MPSLLVLALCLGLAGSPLKGLAFEERFARLAQLTGVSFHSGSGQTWVALNLDSDVSYRTNYLTNPERYYVDLLHTVIAPEFSQRTLPLDHASAKRVRIGQIKPQITRVVLDLASAETTDISISNEAPGLVVLNLPGQMTQALGTGTAPIEMALGSTTEAEGAESSHEIPPSATVQAVQQELPESSVIVSIPRVTRAPELESYLTGELPPASRIEGFRQRNPGDGNPVSESTQAYLSYDENNLYVVFVCQDDPQRIRARMAKRENIRADDQVLVYLNTFDDNRRALVFAANPLGVQRDGIFTEGQDSDFEFDTLWHSEGRLTEDGYLVKIAIPFKSLRFSTNDEQRWSIALGRTIKRKGETAFWPHISRRVEGFVQQMAAFGGPTDIASGSTVDVIPYGTLTRALLRDSSGPEPTFSTDQEATGGLDAKWVLKDTLTLDTTINPDFSQVESDDPQVTINRRFEVFFPEKRPFFLENADFFRTPINLFFSRRIVDPQFGTRLTGQVGGWNVGVLGMDDQAPGEGLSEDDPLQGGRAGIGVFRLQREFGQQSSVGVLLSSRDFSTSSNRVFALDTRLKLSPNWVFSGQFAGSRTRDQEGSQLSGPAYLARLSYSDRNFGYTGSYSDLSPDFRSQLGFIRRVDIRQTTHSTSYFWYPEKGPLLDFGFSFSGSANWDREGRMQDWSFWSSFQSDFKGPANFEISRSEAFTLFAEQEFRTGRTDLSFFTNWTDSLATFGSFGQGSGINFSPASGLEPFLADATSASFGATLRPMPQLRLEHSYTYSRLATGQDPVTVLVPVSTSIFNNHLFRWKLNYQFNRELSFRSIVDYFALLSNDSLINSDRFKRFRFDLLLTYLLNPGTALFVGYTDSYDDLVFDPIVSPTGFRQGAPINPSDHQFFVKISYLFRF